MLQHYNILLLFFTGADYTFIYLYLILSVLVLSKHSSITCRQSDNALYENNTIGTNEGISRVLLNEQKYRLLR